MRFAVLGALVAVGCADHPPSIVDGVEIGEGKADGTGRVENGLLRLGDVVRTALPADAAEQVYTIRLDAPARVRFLTRSEHRVPTQVLVHRHDPGMDPQPFRQSGSQTREDTRDETISRTEFRVRLAETLPPGEYDVTLRASDRYFGYAELSTEIRCALLEGAFTYEEATSTSNIDELDVLQQAQLVEVRGQLDAPPYLAENESALFSTITLDDGRQYTDLTLSFHEYGFSRGAVFGLDSSFALARRDDDRFTSCGIPVSEPVDP